MIATALQQAVDLSLYAWPGQEQHKPDDDDGGEGGHRRLRL